MNAMTEALTYTLDALTALHGALNAGPLAPALSAALFGVLVWALLAGSAWAATR